MTLDSDEKELLDSFERGEWRSVDAGEVAHVREFARNQLRVNGRVDLLDRGEVRGRDAEPARLADRKKPGGPASRPKTP